MFFTQLTFTQLTAMSRRFSCVQVATSKTRKMLIFWGYRRLVAYFPPRTKPGGVRPLKRVIEVSSVEEATENTPLINDLKLYGKRRA